MDPSGLAPNFFQAHGQLDLAAAAAAQQAAAAAATQQAAAAAQQFTDAPAADGAGAMDTDENPPLPNDPPPANFAGAVPAAPGAPAPSNAGAPPQAWFSSWMLPFMLLANAVSSRTTAPAAQTKPSDGLSAFRKPPKFCPNASTSSAQQENRWHVFHSVIDMRIMHLPHTITPMQYLWDNLDTHVQNWARTMGINESSDYHHACNVLAAGPWDMRDPLDIIQQMHTIRFDWKQPAKFMSYLDEAFAAIISAVALTDPTAAVIPDWIKIFLVLTMLPSGLREYMRRVPVTRERWTSYAAFKATFENLTFDTIRTMCQTNHSGTHGASSSRTFSQVVQANKPSTSNLRPNAKPFHPPSPHHSFKGPRLPHRNHKSNGKHTPANSSQRQEDLAKNQCFKCHKPGHNQRNCPLAANK